MRLPNLLATRTGRLTAFFFLYVTEGIPLGFAAVAVVTQLRREGVGAAAIGAFLGSLYLPWALKWAFGPIVDVFAWERLGRRRGWILAMQVLMAATLLVATAVPLPERLGLFTALLLVHNTFGATQDVAIDALAVNTLHEDERGIANGLMFAGASIGQAVGGAGVLFLLRIMPFQGTFLFVAGCILAVTAFVVVPMREPPSEPHGTAHADVGQRGVGARLRSALGSVRDFAVLSFRSVLGSRSSFAALFFALLPAGAMCLGLTLQANLAVEIGLSDDAIAAVSVVSTIVFALSCVFGGFLSDRLGRRRVLAVATLLMSVPALLLMAALIKADWIMPVDVTLPDRPTAPAFVVVAFWCASLLYATFNGVMYGVRSAVFMDVTNPAVAATQFTAYMALMNVTIAYTATWQGIALEAWGYPRTIAIDVVAGLLCLGLIPLLRKVPAGKAEHGDRAAPVRARVLAAALGVLLLAWLPCRLRPELLGDAEPIASTAFTLLFVASAVFLAAGGAVLGGSARVLSRIGAAVAPLLLLMFARHHVGAVSSWLGFGDAPNALTRAADLAFLAIPLLGAVMLLVLAARPWRELAQPAEHSATVAA